MTQPSANIIASVIGIDGGSIVSDDGKMTLSIPLNALLQDTNITVERKSVDQDGALAYELLPAGLQFQTPARMSLDVSSFSTGKTENGVQIESMPVIMTTDDESSGLVNLKNHELLIDHDSSVTTVSADVDHFSGFVVGDFMKLGINVAIEGVPEFAIANAPFGPVRLIVEIPRVSADHTVTGFYNTVGVAGLSYTDLSSEP
jgi:hypothetical protein